MPGKTRSAGPKSSQPGLVFQHGPPGWWDSERVSSPQVMLMQGGTWRMWYYGRDATFDRDINLPSGRSGMAVSRDGVNWERVRGPLTMGAVLEPSTGPDRFDNGHVGVSDVYYDQGLYWMWFLGGDQTVAEFRALRGGGMTKAKGFVMRPGCAISRDGLNWVRLEGPHRGAFLDVGAPGDWDSMMCGWPRVIRDNAGYKMYYHSMDRARLTIGVAVSDDGFRWTKLGPVLGPGERGCFDENGPGCRHVIRVHGQYLMFYEAINSTGYFSIGLAVSDDGLEWRRDTSGEQPGGPMLKPAPSGSGRWDARAAGTPFVVPMPDGSFRMYYIGSNEGADDELSVEHRIGMAVSDGPDFRKWRRYGE